jgi:hypothetical protein
MEIGETATPDGGTCRRTPRSRQDLQDLQDLQDCGGARLNRGYLITMLVAPRLVQRAVAVVPVALGAESTGNTGNTGTTDERLHGCSRI